MPTYEVEIKGHAVIKAENIVEARQLAKKIRIIGERIGSHRAENNKYMVDYEVSIPERHVSMPVRKPKHDY